MQYLPVGSYPGKKFNSKIPALNATACYRYGHIIIISMVLQLLLIWPYIYYCSMATGRIGFLFCELCLILAQGAKFDKFTNRHCWLVLVHMYCNMCACMVFSVQYCPPLFSFTRVVCLQQDSWPRNGLTVFVGLIAPTACLEYTYTRVGTRRTVAFILPTIMSSPR